MHIISGYFMFMKTKTILLRLAEKANASLPAFDFSDLASVAWSFASLGLTEGKLFRTIRERLEVRAALRA